MRKKTANLIIFLLLILIVGEFSYIFSQRNRKEGLYVHVNKAREYMEEEKYEKAISLLCKAFEKAPRSKDIKDNLIYGYVQYARFLGEKDDVDGAIENLQSAYAVDEKQSAVVHDLAYFYCKKAIQNSDQNKPGAARAYLQDATHLAVKSRRIRSSISNYLFNEAVESYNKGGKETVLVCLNMSYLLKKRPETLDFLAQCYYRWSDLEMALFYWEEALKLAQSKKQPPEKDITELREKIEKVKKEMPVKKKMQRIETEHFNVRLHRDYKMNVSVLRGILGKIYNRVGEDLDFYPPPDTPMIFYNEKDFREIFKQRGIVRAFYDGNIRIVFTTDFDNPSFASVAAHEYTHAVISMLTDNKCPIWLHEGIAVYEQQRYAPIVLRNLRRAVKKDKKLSIEEMEKGFKDPADETELTMSYESAYTAVSFILDTWGWSGVRRMLRRIKNGQHFANAIDEEFYLSVRVFEDMWNDYIRQKFSNA